MARVEVNAEIKVYEDEKSETWGDSKLRFVIGSHWNDPNAVVIEIEGKQYTVIAQDVRRALDAATVNR